MPLREDDVAPRAGVPARPTVLQAAGFALAIAATIVVFLTDNPQVLRLAVVGVAWAFVLATVAAGRRSADQVAARAREDQLRLAYEHELDRELAVRREYELEFEADLRREVEESVRAELGALRGDLAGLSALRDELARVADLRTDLAALSALRDEVARVAALRDDVAALTSVRQEIGQLGLLRDDMGRLRQELTEQLSSEMLIERIVMRTQASRLGADLPDRAIDPATRWSGGASAGELTGGWSDLRFDEPVETRQFDQVRVERAARPPVPPAPLVSRPVPSPSWRPSWESPTAQTPPWQTSADGPGSGIYAAPPTTDTPVAPPHAPVVPPTTARPVVPPEPLPTPLEWLAARSVIDAEPTSYRPEVPPRRRRDDPPPAAPAPTSQRPLAPHPPIRIDDRGGYRVIVPDEPAVQPSGPEPSQEKRLADILAENGVAPSTGGRRRRRYRDDDEPDDVLSRVLGDS